MPDADAPDTMAPVDPSGLDCVGTAAAAPLLARFSRAHRAAVRAEWRAAQAAGLEMQIEDDGRILLGAAPSLASTMFNRGLGFTEDPDRVPSAVAFFRRHGVAGEVVLDAADAPPGGEPRIPLDVHLASPAAVRPAPVDGLAVRPVGPDEADAWMSVAIAANGPAPQVAALWRSMAPHMVSTPGWDLSVAELDRRIVAAASLFVADGVGWQSWASVLAEERGRGIQRAMIAARSRAAADQGCDLVAAWALVGAHSSANLERAGLPRIGRRVVIRAADLD